MALPTSSWSNQSRKRATLGPLIGSDKRQFNTCKGNATVQTINSVLDIVQYHVFGDDTGATLMP
jgi:hypothetical protein